MSQSALSNMGGAATISALVHPRPVCLAAPGIGAAAMPAAKAPKKSGRRKPGAARADRTLELAHAKARRLQQKKDLEDPVFDQCYDRFVCVLNIVSRVVPQCHGSYAYAQVWQPKWGSAGVAAERRWLGRPKVAAAGADPQSPAPGSDLARSGCSTHAVANADAKLTDRSG